MENSSVSPGEAVAVWRLDPDLDARQETVLVKTENVEIIHVVIPAGETIPTHEAQGEIVLHCIEGRILLSALDRPRELSAGRLFYFRINEPFSLQGIERASLLLTIVSPKLGKNVELIGT